MNGFKLQSSFILLMSVLVISSTLIFGVLAFERNSTVQSLLKKQYENTLLINKLLDDLKRHMGYGGFIHNFKNLVIRRDISRYQIPIEKNLSDLNTILDKLETLLNYPEDLIAINTLRRIFSEYNQKYHLALSMIMDGKSTSDIDSVVKVFDGDALKAQNALSENVDSYNLIAYQKVQDIEKESLNFIKSGGIIFFIAILTAIATMLIFLYRLIISNTNYLHVKDELNNLLSSTPDPMITVAHNGYIIRVNKMAIQFFGYSQDELLGMKIENLIPSRFRNNHEKQRADFFSHSRYRTMGEGQLELFALLSDGREINVEISLSYFGEDLDRQVTVAIRDVTVQLDNRAAIINSKAAKMESIGHLTAGVAHHLNNYLSGIIGYSELSKDLLNKENTNKIPQYIDQIINEGERANILIQKMLTFSEKSHKTNENTVQVTYVTGVKNKIIPLIRSSLPEMVDLKCNINNNNSDMKICMNHINLQNILFNLIMNSLHAINENGEITVNITEQHCNEMLCNSCHTNFSGDYLKVSVHDNGSVISGAVINKIFDPFFTTKGLANSSGMGLSVVHGLVHSEKGHIVVESSMEAGTIFSIFIPL